MNNIIPEYMIVNENKLNYSFNHKEEFEKWLNVFDIKKEEICIIGSVPLHLVGIRENDDIDFITTKSVNDRILSKIDKYPECKVKNQKIFFGEHMHSHKINHNRFDYFGITNDDLINNEKFHMVVDGFKIFRLELLLSKKIREARPKDLEDVKKIEKSGLIGKLDWDWDIVYSLPYWTKPKESLYVKVRKKIDSDGAIKTLKTYVASLLKRMHLEKVLEKSLLLRDKFIFIKNIWKSGNRYKNYKIMLPMSVILASYLKNNEFFGWDIIFKSTNISENKEFANMKKSVHINENENSSQVILLKDGRILAGKANVSSKLNSDEYWIEIAYENDSFTREYAESVEKVKVSDLQANLLNNKFLESIESKGLIFYAILWPSAYEIFDELEKYIEKEVSIIEMKQYDISHDFSSIIHNFYKSDDRAKTWMIEKKINGIAISITDECRQMRVLKLWIHDPKFRYYTDAEGYLHSKATRSLKTKCRKAFYQKIDNYFYDNLIHFTESYYNNYETANILRELDRNGRCTKSINYLKANPNSFDVPLLSKGDTIDL